MLDAIQDALNFRQEAYNENTCGVVIVCPKTQRTVASSYQEWKAQVENEETNVEDIKTRLRRHPLLTNCLLAIQGVSRLERLSAMGHGMDSETFRNGQVSLQDIPYKRRHLCDGLLIGCMLLDSLDCFASW